MKINKKIIEELTGYLKEFNLSEIEYAEGTTKVKVSRSINSSNIISSEIKKKYSANEENGVHVTSPIVGTAYLAPEPGAKKFLEVGQKVRHDRFGDGIVVSCTAVGYDYQVTVAFKADGGIRNLLLGYANLQLLD